MIRFTLRWTPILKDGLWKAQPSTEAKFLVPDWGDIVDSGIGLSHRAVSMRKDCYNCLGEDETD